MNEVTATLIAGGVGLVGGIGGAVIGSLIGAAATRRAADQQIEANRLDAETEREAARRATVEERYERRLERSRERAASCLETLHAVGLALPNLRGLLLSRSSTPIAATGDLQRAAAARAALQRALRVEAPVLIGTALGGRLQVLMDLVDEVVQWEEGTFSPAQGERGMSDVAQYLRFVRLTAVAHVKGEPPPDSEPTPILRRDDLMPWPGRYIGEWTPWSDRDLWAQDGRGEGEQ